MFDKLLIANRGAIACRILRTLRTLQVKGVAVYSEADAASLHLMQADEAHSLGEGGAAGTYLAMDKILAIAKASGAGAIHPGYGFLSENAAFAQACEDAGIAFVGPTPEQLRVFGLKHTARALARQHGVPMLEGTELLDSVESAIAAARDIGYPVMLKSTAGGGGIGMRVCRSAEELADSFEAVKRLGQNNFSDAGVFIEKYIQRARHLEVQVFGDGQGEVLALGVRDCSVQRRNQKVLEETPAPNLPDGMADELCAAAIKLARAVNYRSAGTVEFVFDSEDQRFYFLEVNTRLQVEHGVTEQVWGVDLVSWMVQLAAGDLPPLEQLQAGLKPSGHAIQARLYAEDPGRDFQPCPGLLTAVNFPPADGHALRIDTWVEAGCEIPPYFDPMIAKLISWAQTREQASTGLIDALNETRLYGVETNRDYLRQIIADTPFSSGQPWTRCLEGLVYHADTFEVLSGGTQTSVQDYPGRLGYWAVGVPPSGPMDSRALRQGNGLLGNAEGCAALEITMSGPLLRFNTDAVIAVTGAQIPITLDGEPRAMNTALLVCAGSTLALGTIAGAGVRSYLCVRGGLEMPDYLGSKSTFTLGQFGGHGGRALRAGDVLHIAPLVDRSAGQRIADDALEALPDIRRIRVIYGPHAAPEYFTEAYIETFFATDWEVHFNSSRTGVRLIGPKPEWVRADGGEAGLHPSNIHDNPYAIGAVDFTGDMPVILGPDGPSLGGFVCPVTIIEADLWQLGQLKAGDKVRFYPVSVEACHAERCGSELVREGYIPDAADQSTVPPSSRTSPLPQGTADSIRSELVREGYIPDAENTSTVPPSSRTSPLLQGTARLQGTANSCGCEAVRIEDLPSPVILDIGQDDKRLVARLSGDTHLLLEIGAPELDLVLRLRGHALMLALEAKQLGGVIDLTPGIRSLQVHYRPEQLPLRQLLDIVAGEWDALCAAKDLQVASRIVHLPLSWDDPACQLAIEKYMTTVRKDAPWCPSNLEFIRRINDLPNLDEVQRTVFDASYLVMGLGDVYLGAPVATPLDPRHRLVTTKYNPARTWTAENSVGIGGAYMCVYGMEGPGGYQFVGRTLQMWNRYRDVAAFEGKPWLLRFFDQIRFYPVSADELLRIRRDFPLGRFDLNIEHSTLNMADYQAFLTREAEGITAFRAQQQSAFNAERERWIANGQADFQSDEGVAPNTEELPLQTGQQGVDSHIAGNLWQVQVQPGERVEAGDVLVILESMKMEIPLLAPVAGVVQEVRVQPGSAVRAGQRVVVLAAD
ncbi:urea carboxylase [Pseudomonas savastanoi pv. phaseolicola]|uniref:Biotin carboxylase n=10 Tax=Pseudomonas savastanoi TaxID=29438 RepID=Q48ES7_PSE14|nr:MULTISPECIES: urea carboxylase [Pseudomonas]AAZ33603.1 urea amidolyase homologue [Pseudomonas savastanoi pv. phaseolicola 1448A]KPB38614.1 Urea amidolyase -like proteinue [Pseudomonas savastanoi pv. phaseolicola]KPB57753.1 Urea amidolyase -like proteinue [Pseudomonas savastanoi pv. phaseolicola]KPB66407.1 Urea amidolyase -like proteinue [Pseudomonas amygdali pv. mellea]KPY20014.1 Urea amidolyase -like proteinue [Pseudomonas savastanoi pv. phaseolicola]